MKKNKKNKKNNNYRIYIGIIVLVLVTVFISSNNAKQKEQQNIDDLFDREIILDVQEFSEQGAEHISESGLFSYNSNPPTSGSHYGQAPAWGFYSKEIDDESENETEMGKGLKS